MIRYLKNKTYEERLQELGPNNLEERRGRGDAIETYNILNDYYDVPKSIVQPGEGRRRASTMEAAACGACLTAARALSPLSALHELHQLYCALLLPAEPANAQDSIKKEQSGVYVCWECRAALRNTLRFQRRAARAREWLACMSTQQRAEVTCKSLSSLQCSHKTHYDFEIIEDLTSMKKEIHSEEGFPADPVDYDSDIEDSKPVIELAKVAVPETKLVEPENVKSEKSKSKVKSLPKPYEMIGRISKQSLSKKKLNKPYTMTKVSGKEISRLREEARTKPKYLNAPFKCESCIIPFQFVKAYEKHLKLKHSDIASYHLCDICNRTFKTERVLKLHKRSHYRHYRCNDCDLTSLSGTAMGKHYIVKHQTRPSTANRYKCLECGVRFKSHLTDCKLCGHVLSSRANLRNHQYFVHQTHDVSTSDAYCVECDKKFKHRIAYNEHLKRVHRSIENKFSCTKCDKIFTRKNYLINHIEHIHLRASRFQCHLCSKTFLRRGGMRRHIDSVHEGITLPRTKMCEICDRGFQTKNILDNHRRTHTGERPYQCEHCSAAFTQVTSLKTHMKRIHQQERTERQLSKKVHDEATDADPNAWTPTVGRRRV